MLQSLETAPKTVHHNEMNDYNHEHNYISLLMSPDLPVCINEKILNFSSFYVPQIFCSEQQHGMCVRSDNARALYVASTYITCCILCKHAHSCTHARTRSMLKLFVFPSHSHASKSCYRTREGGGYLDMHSWWRCYYLTITDKTS